MTRSAQEIETIFTRHGVADPAVRERLVAGAGQEVLWRLHRTSDPAGRFLRSLERRCQELNTTGDEDR